MNNPFTASMVIIFATMIIDCIVLIIINRSESPYKLKLWHILAWHIPMYAATGWLAWHIPMYAATGWLGWHFSTLSVWGSCQ